MDMHETVGNAACRAAQQYSKSKHTLDKTGTQLSPHEHRVTAKQPTQHKTYVHIFGKCCWRHTRTCGRALSVLMVKDRYDCACR